MHQLDFKDYVTFVLAFLLGLMIAQSLKHQLPPVGETIPPATVVEVPDDKVEEQIEDEIEDDIQIETETTVEDEVVKEIVNSSPSTVLQVRRGSVWFGRRR